MKNLIACLMLIVTCLASKAQTVTAKPDKGINLIGFFQGSWKGEGQFANGKKIAANSTFKLSLDSCWLIYTHEDIAPNHLYSSAKDYYSDKHGLLPVILLS